MAIGILGRKVGMTQVFNESGQTVPVTVVKAGPCHVLQLRTLERDGYEAVQMGFEDKPRRLAARSERGHVAKLDSKRSKRLSAAGVQLAEKANCEPKRVVREFRGSIEGFEVGAELAADTFAEVGSVDVTATSKGRGFAGVMKRHNFAGQRATHGVKKCHPGRLFKGIRMPGRYGGKRVTVLNQKLVSVDAENGLLVINGAVPGPNGGVVLIRPTNIL